MIPLAAGMQTVSKTVSFSELTQSTPADSLSQDTAVAIQPPDFHLQIPANLWRAQCSHRAFLARRRRTNGSMASLEPGQRNLDKQTAAALDLPELQAMLLQAKLGRRNEIPTESAPALTFWGSSQQAFLDALAPSPEAQPMGNVI